MHRRRRTVAIPVHHYIYRLLIRPPDFPRILIMFLSGRPHPHHPPLLWWWCFCFFLISCACGNDLTAGAPAGLSLANRATPSWAPGCGRFAALRGDPVGRCWLMCICVAREPMRVWWCLYRCSVSHIVCEWVGAQLTALCCVTLARCGKLGCVQGLGGLCDFLFSFFRLCDLTCLQPYRTGGKQQDHVGVRALLSSRFICIVLGWLAFPVCAMCIVLHNTRHI